MSSRRQSEVALEIAVAALCAGVAVTCASEGQLRPSAAAPVPSGAAAPQAAPPEPAGSVEPPAGAGASPARAPGPLPELDGFYAALRDLEEQRRAERVRVLWLGDSHTAGDFWPATVARALQARFGNGGPGFVPVGQRSAYRAGTTLEASGSWKREPKAPSSPLPQDDGVFGLCGTRSVPGDGAATATVRLRSGAVPASARWELIYRRPTAGSGFRVEVDAAPVAVPAAGGGGAIERLVFQSGPTATFELSESAGRPQLFGAVIEANGPGVVFDVCGINGARARTPLAWDEATFVAEVAARRPELVILAYGTNEVVDDAPPERYAQHYRDLLGRLRQAVPEVECLLAGPTDLAKASMSHPRVRAIDAVQSRVAAELGCAFFSVAQAMGGEGSILRWMDASPPMARPDGIHLTREGYEHVGQEMADALLRSYDAAR